MKNKEINRIVGKCKINLHMFLLIEYNDSDELKWELGFDIKIKENIRKIKQFNESIKTQPLPYIHSDYSSYAKELIEKCHKFYDKIMALPQHSRKIQRIVGKAKINDILHCLVQWKDYPNSQATWVNSSKLWNFSRLNMKPFYDQTKNRQIPFVFPGFQSHLSRICQESLNSESDGDNEIEKDTKKIKKQRKIKQRINSVKHHSEELQESNGQKIVEQNSSGDIEKYSQIVDGQSIRQEDSLGESQFSPSSKKQNKNHLKKRELVQKDSQNKNQKIENKIKPTLKNKVKNFNKNSNQQIQDKKSLRSHKISIKEMKNKIIEQSKANDFTGKNLEDKKKKQKQPCDLTEETKIEEGYQSPNKNQQNCQTIKANNVNSQIKIALNHSQERQIFNNISMSKQTQSNDQQRLQKSRIQMKKMYENWNLKNEHTFSKIQISLQCEDVPTDDSNQGFQNLYRVIAYFDNKEIKISKIQGHNFRKETKFLLTSQMLQQYPKEFVHYLESQLKQTSSIKKLSK